MFSFFKTELFILHLSDHTCHQLQNTSRSINMHGGIEKMDPNITIPDTWAENSNHNIQESQGESANTSLPCESLRNTRAHPKVNNEALLPIRLNCLLHCQGYSISRGSLVLAFRSKLRKDMQNLFRLHKL